MTDVDAPRTGPRGGAGRTRGPGGTVPLVSLCTDFGHGSEGVGLMHGAILAVTGEVHILDLTHDVAVFDTVEGAREMETVWWLPTGIHVCVVDPGVGGDRRPIVVETGRGDLLVGPDNGVLLPAAARLGGARRCFEITNPSVMRQPVSATFHGRDVFATCAAWLAAGFPLDEVGGELPMEALAAAAFVEAAADPSGRVRAQVIHINRFGSASLNVYAAAMAELGFRPGDRLSVRTPLRTLELTFVRTFSDVGAGEAIALADPYERVALAVNLGSFARETGLEMHARVEICRA